MVDMKHRRTQEECRRLILLFFLEAFSRALETEVEIDGFHVSFQSVLNIIKKKLGSDRAQEIEALGFKFDNITKRSAVVNELLRVFDTAEFISIEWQGDSERIVLVPRTISQIVRMISTEYRVSPEEIGFLVTVSGLGVRSYKHLTSRPNRAD